MAGAGLGLAALVRPSAVRAADWPSHPIRFVVPFTPGGANDLIGRAAAEGAARELGQNIIVENRPGAGTTVGAQSVARATPDGYTFLVTSAGILSNPAIRKTLPYKEADLVPVAMIALAPSIVFVPADAPYGDLKAFIEASKRAPLNFATAGTGSTPHFVAEMLRANGANLQIVPYKSGSESVTAVIGRQVEATSEASIVVLPQIRAGKVKALASTWTQRMKAAPDLPTAAEQGLANVDITHWAGVHAPRGTPDAIMDRVAHAVDAAMKSADIAKRLSDVGIEPIGGTRESFVKFCDAERTRLVTIARSAGMKEE